MSENKRGDGIWMAVKVACLVVLSVAVLGGLPGSAEAFDFCTDYDNALSQTTGLFTDIRRNADINADTTNCLLNFTGSTGSATDMWITLAHAPGDTTPTYDCTEVEGDFTIHRFDNRKGIGIVALYDDATNIGLFFAMYDNGNTDAITLSVINGATGKIVKDLATVPLGSKIKENVSYELEFSFCSSGDTLSVTGSVENSAGSSEGTGCTEDPSTVCLTYTGSLSAAGLSSTGFIGLAGWAKNAFVDATVSSFGF